MAKFNVGDVVKVVKRNADDVRSGTAASEEYIGSIGVVARLATDDHGATEADPMYEVRIPGMTPESFWGEELTAATTRMVNRKGAFAADVWSLQRDIRRRHALEKDAAKVRKAKAKARARACRTVGMPADEVAALEPLAKLTRYACQNRMEWGGVSRFQVGMVVEARAVIVDHDEHGSPYIHATPGMLGVVVHMESDAADEWPTVAWAPQGHGCCDTSPHHIEPYSGAVLRVTEPS